MPGGPRSWERQEGASPPASAETHPAHALNRRRLLLSRTGSKFKPTRLWISVSAAEPGKEYRVQSTQVSAQPATEERGLASHTAGCWSCLGSLATAWLQGRWEGAERYSTLLPSLCAAHSPEAGRCEWRQACGDGWWSRGYIEIVSTGPRPPAGHFCWAETSG
jgi:hypothetical protein